jgi:hypothetical protein
MALGAALWARAAGAQAQTRAPARAAAKGSLIMAVSPAKGERDTVGLRRRAVNPRFKRRAARDNR